jgi:hypothetical protein
MRFRDDLIELIARFDPLEVVMNVVRSKPFPTFANLCSAEFGDALDQFQRCGL